MSNRILAFSLVNSAAAACLPARSLVLFCAYGPQAPWSSILVDLSSITQQQCKTGPGVEGGRGHGRDRGYSAVQCGTMAQAAR